MRFAFVALLAMLISTPGCSTAGKGQVARKADKPIVTPAGIPKGKVAKVNINARYVIVTFAMGSMPSNGQPAQVYRKGLRVGTVRITGPQQGENTAADIVDGEVTEGDEVRLN